MLQGEIRVMEVVEASSRRKDWLDRHRRLIEYWALRAWDAATHPPEDQPEHVTLAHQRAVERLYGPTLILARTRRADGWRRLRAYREALGKARTPQERRKAIRLLEE